VELFDVATRVSDDMDSLKYFIPYDMQPWYETGYFDAHIENLPLYEEIADAFNGKEAIGVRIYEEQKIIQNADLPDTFTGDEKLLSRWDMISSSVIPTANAISTCYEGEGYFGMAFGENARYLPESAFKKGLVLDLKAAEILQNKGIDTGLISKKFKCCWSQEYFCEYDTAVDSTGDHVYDINIKDTAKVLSVFRCDGEEIPGSYIYENENGQRFLVYAFNAEQSCQNSSRFLSYAKGQQLADYAKWLGGKALPAVCIGYPMLYSIAKENEKEKAFAYFNCHLDEVKNANIKLSFKAKNVKFINCTGSCTEDGVIIDYIKPFGFAAFTVEY
jgi:hypothetical protein